MVPTTLFIIRGMPGSGKTTLAKLIADAVYSADDFFTHNGVYEFEPHKLPEAHEWCRCIVHESLVLALGGNHRKKIAVANTFSQLWEFSAYVEMTEKLGVQFFVIDLFDQGYNDQELFERCTHPVPLHIFENQRRRWQH